MAMIVAAPASPFASPADPYVHLNASLYVQNLALLHAPLHVKKHAHLHARHHAQHLALSLASRHVLNHAAIHVLQDVRHLLSHVNTDLQESVHAMG